MSPYLKVKNKNKNFLWTSEVDKNGHKEPSFNEKIKIPFSSVTDEIEITIMDKDMFDDDEIGTMLFKPIETIGSFHSIIEKTFVYDNYKIGTLKFRVLEGPKVKWSFELIVRLWNSLYLLMKIFILLSLVILSVCFDPLINSKATPEAKKLFQRMTANYGKRIYSGQTNFHFSDLVKKVGRHPVVQAFDLQNYSPHNPWYNWQPYDDGTVASAI